MGMQQRSVLSPFIIAVVGNVTKLTRKIVLSRRMLIILS